MDSNFLLPGAMGQGDWEQPHQDHEWWYDNAGRRLACSMLRSVKHGEYGELVYPAIDYAASLLRGGTEPENVALNARIGKPKTNGFVAIAGDVTPKAMMNAYARGLHQASHILPGKWRVYDKRMVMFFDKFHVSKRLRRTMRKSNYTFTFDKAFGQVVAGCARPRGGFLSLTWLLPEIAQTFVQLHQMGHAHSLEVWNERGELAAGMFGVAYGRIFITETLFSNEDDAAKLGFAVLMRHLQEWGFAFHDNGKGSPHFLTNGGELLDREPFLGLVDDLGDYEKPAHPGAWQIDPQLLENWDKTGENITRRAELLSEINAAG